MKDKELCFPAAINGISDDFLEEACQADLFFSRKKRNRILYWAAAFLLIICLGTLWIGRAYKTAQLKRATSSAETYESWEITEDGMTDSDELP